MAEEKIRFQLRLSPEVNEKVKAAMPLAHARSQNEFVEQALRFYCGYVMADEATDFLPLALSTSVRSNVQMTENRLARLLFKQAVELDMMMNVLAFAVEVTPEQLNDLRGRCMYEVKKTSGTITFEDAVRYQQRPE